MQVKCNIFFVLVVLLFGSCDETKKVIDVAGSAQLSGTYTVTMIGESQTTSKVEQTFTLSTSDKSIRGNTGCNSFFGSYNNELYALTFNDLAHTEMACSAIIMTAEQALINALGNTGSYTIENKQLTLLSKNDRSVLLKALKNTN